MNLIVRKIEAYFGRLCVRLVIGASTYSSHEESVLQTVSSGKHFDEDSKFLSFLHDKLKNIESSSRDSVEKSKRLKVKSQEREKNSRDETEKNVREERSPSQRSNSRISRQSRRRSKSRERRERSRSRLRSSNSGLSPERGRRSKTSDRRQRSFSRERRQRLRSISREKGQRSSSRDRRQKSPYRERRHRSTSRERRHRSSSRERRQRSTTRERRKRLRSMSRERRQISRGRKRRSRSRERRQRSKTREKRQKSRSRDIEQPRRLAREEKSDSLSLSPSPIRREAQSPQRSLFDLRRKLTGPRDPALSHWRSGSTSGPGAERRSEARPTPALTIMGYQRTQRRSRSASRSPEKEKTPTEEEEEEEVIQALEEDTPTDQHRERVRRLQLREEGAALAQLAKERGEYYKNSNSHPKYTEMWESFWFLKNKNLSVQGIDITTVDLTPEWQKTWKKFVDKENMKKVKAKKAEIAMKYNQILRDPSRLTETEPTAEVITLSESESEEELPDTPPPPPPQIFKTDEVKLDDSLDQPRQRQQARPQEEVKVLSLLNLLLHLQLSSKGLLSSCDRISHLREVALNKESERYDSSQELLHDFECFNLLDLAAETLKTKLDHKEVPELHSPVVKIALEQISIFQKKSSCQKSDILEIERHSPIRTDDSSVLKLSITKKIERELQARGKTLSPKEIKSLVDAEYVREKHKLPSNVQNTIKLQPPPSPPLYPGPSHSHSNNELFSAYSSDLPVQQAVSTGSAHSPLDWTNIMRGIQSIQYKANVGFIQNIHSVPSPDNNQNSERSDLPDAELANLLMKFDELDDNQKQLLIYQMRELDTVDPEKVRRINKLVNSQKRRTM